MQFNRFVSNVNLLCGHPLGVRRYLNIGSVNPELARQSACNLDWDQNAFPGALADLSDKTLRSTPCTENIKVILAMWMDKNGAVDAGAGRTRELKLPGISFPGQSNFETLRRR